ncbi:MAG: hypothetical protein GWN67_17655 [Phycisphaerae bacterium]|nr:hypothetical protein [Phycisphaerae bacterium]NIP52928.1 hypothetical protein [Phycisphaerae bacterium]NIS51979.1 hypothetical protein [Phycisphaerae bacterium]NIU09493.1 hypothetical protein [Phycisphaerae bacterium]NIU58144.1 hypothetical protein [Phycisphaerae bacterium]
MKLFRQNVLKKQWIPVALVVLGLITSSSSGQYELDWYTIDGGGGRSSGGPYELLGTIGQPDAAWSAGGDYELLGGFLSGGPLCFIDFDSFARFAEYWLEKGVGLPADLYEDENNIVNKLDLGVFVDQWLCYCPAGWPLK